ncbi:hypothetical protein GCM10008931_43410 [Oceanobacillus oncorhynchi subsp. oncorhynchi]|uniref:hypothetical protein n=1 Tax=Oceanobacillus oncorhynchi TaxID=545501 RepID=UPI0031D8D088
MEVLIEVTCHNCDNPSNRKRLNIKVDKEDGTREIWANCDCGDQEYICDENEIIG